MGVKIPSQRRGRKTDSKNYLRIRSKSKNIDNKFKSKQKRNKDLNIFIEDEKSNADQLFDRLNRLIKKAELAY